MATNQNKAPKPTEFRYSDAETEMITKVYVCSPYRPMSTDPEKAKQELKDNLGLATEACRFLTMLGYMPMAPHLYFTQFLDDSKPDERADGMTMGSEWIEICDEMWVFGDRISEGMKDEIDLAKAKGMPIYHCKDPMKMFVKLFEFGDEDDDGEDDDEVFCDQCPHTDCLERNRSKRDSDSDEHNSAQESRSNEEEPMSLSEAFLTVIEMLAVSYDRLKQHGMTPEKNGQSDESGGADKPQEASYGRTE